MLPVDEFRIFQKWKNERGIDIIPIIKTLWQRRFFFLKVVSATAIIGLLISFLLPKQYTSSATLMPEYNAESTGGGASQLLQQYGGMLGIDGGTYASNSNAIRVELYPNIVQSLPFQLGLLKHEYHFPEMDTTAILKTYLREVNSPSLFNFLSDNTSIPVQDKRTVGTQGQIDSKVDLDWTDVDILDLSEREMELIEYLQQRTSASLDQETATLSIQATMPDARLSAEVAQQIIHQLRNYLAAYRKEKLKMDLSYLREQQMRAERRMEEIRDSLAAFRDSHKNIVTASASMKEERIQNRLDRATSLYTGLVRQLEQTEMRLDEDTPVFQVLQPVQVPLGESSPNRFLILLVSVFLGLAGAAGYVLIQQWRDSVDWKTSE